MPTRSCFGCGAGEVGEDGIPEGLEICGQYLCPTCEAHIVRTQVGNEDYDLWIDRCRQFWRGMGIDLRRPAEEKSEVSPSSHPQSGESSDPESKS